MAEFENLPIHIQQVAEAELQTDEQICLCVLSRSSLLRPDFVLITTARVLILDERYMGSLAISYANVRCNVLFSEISTVKLTRFLRHRLFGQARLEIGVKRNTFWVDTMNFRESQRAHQLIATQMLKLKLES